ncbi:ABC transporter substrate-binding protein [Shewanella sp. OMA3-2]|uniref:ABC transporter substrate-binding protein n=1 Tax=Shewanella sp. OMA3-2 TaxID=2908650 RepID=UPI001F1EFF0F|nr:ABC transporter substrate-binding protein [Shewanella sp. OMA3-2]UJF21867.1 ABC transporter substrate-binding protein [Shewanella sp. OMA3-2]
MNFQLPVFIMLVALLLACQPNSTVNSQKNTASVIKIAVSNTPLSTPLFVAQEKGFFKQHGLHVELIKHEGGVKCFEALIAQQVDFATSSETVVMFNSFYRSDFSILASFVESDNDVKLISLSAKKYHNLANLKNTKVGIIKGSASEFFFDSLLMLHHQQDLPIERVYLSPKELIPALESGEVDAISAWEPFGYQILQKTNSANQVMSTKGLYDLSFNLLGLKENQVSLKKRQSLLKALNDAIDFISENPAESQLIASQTLDIDLQELRYLWKDYSFRVSLSNALVSNMQSQAQWAIDNRLALENNRIDIRMIIDKQLFESAISQHQDEH